MASPTPERGIYDQGHRHRDDLVHPVERPAEKAAAERIEADEQHKHEHPERADRIQRCDGTVEQRNVEVARTIGDKWLVRSGLMAGDRVIVEGVQKVQPGMPVEAFIKTGDRNVISYLSKPLTDQAIVNILKKEGIQIARRTVAKYRDQLGILSARMRKRV